MRLLSRYFVREMLLPFFFSLLMITFILFINFLLRAIDRFLGKGLDVGSYLASHPSIYCAISAHGDPPGNAHGFWPLIGR